VKEGVNHLPLSAGGAAWYNHVGEVVFLDADVLGGYKRREPCDPSDARLGLVEPLIFGP
jgi:hypothetical protein